MSINSKSGFTDPLSIRSQKPEDQPKDGKQSPWDFRCSQYDQRSSNFINAGTHYGVGRNNPVGHLGEPQQVVSTLPQGKVKTMRNDEKG